MGQKLTFGVVIEQQFWSWASNVEQWKIAEAQGFDSIWINDHFHSLGESIDQEGFEASTTLAALAMETTRPKIGVLTYGNTHRNPAILAKEMVTIDHMSGGRVSSASARAGTSRSTRPTASRSRARGTEWRCSARRWT